MNIKTLEKLSVRNKWTPTPLRFGLLKCTLVAASNSLFFLLYICPKAAQNNRSYAERSIRGSSWNNSDNSKPTETPSFASRPFNNLCSSLQTARRLQLLQRIVLRTTALLLWARESEMGCSWDLSTFPMMLQPELFTSVAVIVSVAVIAGWYCLLSSSTDKTIVLLLC